MRDNYLFIILMLLVFAAIDFYVFMGIRSLMQHSSVVSRKTVYILYWCFSIAVLATLALYFFGNGQHWSRLAKSLLTGLQLFNFIPKLFLLVFILLDDIQRGVRWAVSKLTVISANTPALQDVNIPRSEFLIKTGIIVAAIPLVSVSYGMITGAHDYRVRKVKLPLKNLPSSFHGMTIAQLSDIHSGSFFRKKAVLGGVEMLLKEKPDAIFFTGDLVNEKADELRDYLDIFSKVKAPLGVYSTLGNHDYGEYVRWSSASAKAANLRDLKEAHRIMGWNLLNNQHHMLKQGGDQLAIVGVENWGAGSGWPKYGNLKQALTGTEEASARLLLSHDPSHWDAQIRPMFPEVDVTFSGHTHGFQFGIEIGDFKWSPVQYVYKQWAGLYKENEQMLYVNRGFGFLGFPGRIGMPPEITIFELVKA